MRRLLVLAALCASCTTQDEFRAAGSSLEFGGYTGKIATDGSFSRTDKSINTDADSYGVFASIRPFEYWHMKMQAEATARAITEAQYAAAMKERECATKPTTDSKPR